MLLPWQIDAPCHTHGCSNRIEYKLVPEQFRDISAGVIAGLCQDCVTSALSGVATPEIEKGPAVGWAEVDAFLRTHMSDAVAVSVIEGATGMFLTPPKPPGTVMVDLPPARAADTAEKVVKTPARPAPRRATRRTKGAK